MTSELDGVVDALPGLVWTAGLDGAADYLNHRWLEFTGLTADAAIGTGWQEAVHPNDRLQLLNQWAEHVSRGEAGQLEARLKRHDGVYQWFNFGFAPLTDASGRIVKWCGINTNIDDLRRAEAAARTKATEQSLHLIIDSTPALLWSARPDGLTESVNQHFLDYVGYSLEELMDHGWAFAIHPDDQPGLLAVWDSLRASGIAGQSEARLRRSDGEYRWFLLRANPLRDESGSIVKWYGVNIDIEDLKRAEEELKRREALLQQGEKVSETGSFLWRLRSGEFRWSDQMYRIHGLEPGIAVSLATIASRTHPDDLAALDDMVHRAHSGEDFEYEHRLLFPDGLVKHLHLVGHATRDKDGNLEFIGAAQDITERHVSEQALNKVRAELAHIARVTSLGALAASIAHEVNQPLAGIITNASTCLRMLAADPPNIDGARATAQRTLRDGTRASDVIQRLRKLFAQEHRVDDAVDLNDAAREVLALSSSELRGLGLVLKTELDERLPTVKGDRVQLQQVMLNLILNAADAMKSIEDRTRSLLVSTAHEGASVRLSVCDAGVGVEAKNLEKLFDSFYTTKKHGMGMGLSISRSIIENHGGRLWATCNDGPGATFSFAIPPG